MSTSDSSTPSKVCRQCGCEKPATAEFFDRGKVYAGGLRSQCKECIRAYLREWRTAHPEKIVAQHRSYQKAKPEKAAARLVAWRAAHPETNRIAHALYMRNRRAMTKGSVGSHTAADIQAQYDRQKGKCFWCHCLLDKYHVDHVIPLALGGSNGPENLVIACPTCNLSKGAKHPADFAGVML